MNHLHFSNLLRLILLLAGVFISSHTLAQPSQEEVLLDVFRGVLGGRAAVQVATPQDELFKEVIERGSCKQSRDNGLFCEYKVGKKLWFTIRDVGGRDEAIVFRHSDWDEDYYAVSHAGCIAIVPGAVNQNKFGNQNGVYISPKNGRVFRALGECRSSNRQ
jgi:hypothetical protein